MKRSQMRCAEAVEVSSRPSTGPFFAGLTVDEAARALGITIADPELARANDVLE